MVLSGGSRHPERLTFVFTAIWYAVLLGFGHLQTLGGGLLALLAAGFAQNVAMISMGATLLSAAGAEFRGRVMGVRQLAVYGLPVGLMAARRMPVKTGVQGMIGKTGEVRSPELVFVDGKPEKSRYRTYKVRAPGRAVRAGGVARGGWLAPVKVRPGSRPAPRRS